VKSEFLLPAGKPWDAVTARLTMHLNKCDHGKSWLVTVELKKSTRSLQQNAYVWGVCYPTILEAGGETLRGWTATDLHELFLIEHFGHEVIEGFGRKRLKPLKRSAKLSTVEFSDFIAYIHRRAAEIGVVIPDPDQEFASDEAS
jgi:hypothetical protein